jgi:uncharacterized membrane protein YfcA
MMLYGWAELATLTPVDPPLTTLLLIALLVSFTHFVGSFAAYGSSLLAMPFFMALTRDLHFSVGVLLILGSVQAAVILRKNHRFIDWKRLVKVSGAMILGAPIGILLMDRLPRREILILLGIVLVSLGSLGLVRQREIHRRWPPMANLLVLMGAGALHGAFASGGSLLILYARSELPNKQALRATLAMVWIVIDLLLLLRLVLSGHFELRVLPAAAFGSVAVVAAGLVVETLVGKFSQRAFMLLISFLLILSGTVTLVRMLWID